MPLPLLDYICPGVTTVIIFSRKRKPHTLKVCELQVFGELKASHKGFIFMGYFFITTFPSVIVAHWLIKSSSTSYKTTQLP